MLAGGEHRRRVCVYSLSFLRQRQIRRILELSGFSVSTGWPRRGDAVGVWGQRPVSARGRWVSRNSGAPVVHLEDGFLRSVYPAVAGDAPLSLIIDNIGIYYDGSRPSRLETTLQNQAFDIDLLTRAKAGIKALIDARVSKYTPPTPQSEFEQGYVLVIDQTRGDASISGAGADAHTFEQMLATARSENPGKPILIKTHPDVIAGKRAGHFGSTSLSGDERLITNDVNPWDVIAGASIVYTVSSQMGYEAILAGKKLRCFGRAFYAGWGLSEDEQQITRRSRTLSREELFAGCHLIYPTYYDPWRDRLCGFEDTLKVLQHLVCSESEATNPNGEAFVGVRLWKRQTVAGFRPRRGPPPRFVDRILQAKDLVRTEGRHVWIWASKFSADALDELQAKQPGGGFVEDGFLRSVGLGAQLTEASSLVFDRSGIYFDPSRRSDLEEMIRSAASGAADRERAAALRLMISEAGVTKYNVGRTTTRPDAGSRKIILVPGQVEDDASIQRGCGDVRTNLGLLQAARQANPEAWVIYKPHPDVEAGLRVGAVDPSVARSLANEIAQDVSAASLIAHADAVWTLTSLMGFEALMRGVPVTCLGSPFYAGWGLTEDLGPAMPRRTARPSLDDLVWAALIAYPRYRDPVSGLSCPPEVIVERLATGTPHRRANILSKLQSMFAGFQQVWR
ncbi:MAG: capsular polysaccharide biosynthesis protein [Pseudomonadota bacterium]